jgi:hypothetical protein
MCEFMKTSTLASYRREDYGKVLRNTEHPMTQALLNTQKKGWLIILETGPKYYSLSIIRDYHCYMSGKWMTCNHKWKRYRKIMVL